MKELFKKLGLYFCSHTCSLSIMNAALPYIALSGENCCFFESHVCSWEDWLQMYWLSHLLTFKQPDVICHVINQWYHEDRDDSYDYTYYHFSVNQGLCAC
jgi:hypothetical protein